MDLDILHGPGPAPDMKFCPLPSWCRWPAFLLFLFFLAKGLVWLFILFLGYNLL